MRTRVITIFAILMFAATAMAAETGALSHRATDVAVPVLVAQAPPGAGPAQPSPAPEMAPAAESEKPPPAPEAAPAAEAAQVPSAGETPQGPGEPPVAAPEGEAGKPVKEEAVPGAETAQPPAPPTPSYPYPRRFVPPATAASPGAPAPRAAGGGFLVKFNNADIYEVIHTLARMAGINYLIDPRVRGVVNVQTQGTVNKEGALELLLSILRINGATAVREGEIYHIVPLAEAKMEPLMPEEWKEKNGDPSSNRPVLRAFPLQYTVAAEMAKVLKPFVSAGGDVTEVPVANMVLMMDTAANMEKHARLVELFDREPPGTSRMVYLYRVRHGKVEDVMNILTKLFPGKTAAVPGKQTAFKPKVAEPVVKSAAAVARQEERSAAGQEGGTREGGFDIIQDEPTNSIIIRGSPSEYASLINVLKVIDVYPHQVLLEVLIAEVKLDDALRLGVDWKYMSRSGDWTHDVSVSTSAAGISQGMLYAFEKTDRLLGSVRALADDGKVSILSSPSVISTNGKQSKVQVAEQIPVTSGQVTNVAGTADVITETVEYRDVGIILTFTPYINDAGLVTLEIDQEVSEVAGATGGPLNNPTFIKRSIQTTLLATQDRSIVLGGLVKERRERSRDGIPFLYKIPIFGWIFGARSASVSRTELLIFITPRVIESVEEGTQLSREFEDRVEELKRRIGEAEGLKPILKEPQREDNP
ncbi:MAG: hypothetical protein OEM47_02400 [Deltaproteobacteria bacterium]|nr:hypothetical protein [Deltaproteobacteria bacterium]